MSRVINIVVQILILVVVGLAGVIIGREIGIFQQTQRDLSLINKAELSSALAHSPLLNSISVAGKVKEIRKKSIILTNQIETADLQVHLTAETPVFLYSPSSPEPYLKLGANQIKIGDEVKIEIGVSSDYKLEARWILVIPSVK